MSICAEEQHLRHWMACHPYPLAKTSQKFVTEVFAVLKKKTLGPAGQTRTHSQHALTVQQ